MYPTHRRSRTKNSHTFARALTPMLEALECRKLLHAGDLDLTFGDQGVVNNVLPSNAHIWDIAVQSDNKIVAVGSLYQDVGGTTQSVDSFVARLNPDGTPDSTFDGNGIHVLDVAATESATSVAILSSGQILVGGSSGAGYLARLNSNGSLDTSFGGGDGIVQDSGAVAALLPLTSGKILTVGGDVVSRFNGDGSLDTAFASAGKINLVSAAGLRIFDGIDVDVQSSGKILVTGTGAMPDNSTTDAQVVRLTTSGALDTTFGSNGVADINIGMYDGGQGSIIQSSDKIVVLVNRDDPVGNLIRLNADGSRDITFGGEYGVGTPTTNGDWPDNPQDIAQDATGRILVSAASLYLHSGEAMSVGRYNADGTPDVLFSANGKTDIDANAYGDQIAVAPNGDIIAAGDATLVRIQGNSRPHATGGTAQFFNGLLTITGTSGADDIGVSYKLVTVNGVSYDFSSENITKIIIDAGDGDDYVLIDVTGGYGIAAPASITGGAGNDILIGGLGDDTISGGDDNDLVYSGRGANAVSLGNGDDVFSFEFPGRAETVTASPPPGATVHGDAGNDTINGGIFDDSLVGGDGHDRIFGGDGNDTLDGGAGYDFLAGNAGNDLLLGGTEDDNLFGGVGNDAMQGGDGNDLLYGQEDNDSIEGNNGNDYIDAGGGDDSIWGQAGADSLYGNTGNDEIHADDGAADAVADGVAGTDLIYYDTGLDNPQNAQFLAPTTGAASVYGTSGNDDLSVDTDTGLSDTDITVNINGVYHTIPYRAAGIALYGLDGDDEVDSANFSRTGTPVTLDGGNGNDSFWISDADAFVYGGDGNDSVKIEANSGLQGYVAGAGIDSLTTQFWSGSDNFNMNLYPDLENFTADISDKVTGNSLDNRITVNSGNVTLLGMDGNDTLIGGPGNDTLDGGNGDDLLSISQVTTIVPSAGFDALVAGNGRAVVPAATYSKTLYLNTLNIQDSAVLDLNDHNLVVNNADFSTIQQLIFQGYRTSADSNATGIISTTGQTTPGNPILALFDNALVHATDWPAGSGRTIGANAIVGMYTCFGDTNLDGQVTADDYGALDANFGAKNVPSGVAWITGDTNFDGQITADDYGALDANFGRSILN